MECIFFVINYYQKKTLECNKEIIELKHNGCPVRQICEKYRFSKNTTLYYFECSLQNTRQEK